MDDECSETVLYIKQGKVLVKSQPKLKINIKLKKSTKLCFVYTSKKIFFYSFYLISVALIDFDDDSITAFSIENKVLTVNKILTHVETNQHYRNY